MMSASRRTNTRSRFLDTTHAQNRKSSLHYILLLALVGAAVFASAVSAGYVGTRYVRGVRKRRTTGSQIPASIPNHRTSDLNSTLLSSIQSAQAEVWTDKADYNPEDTVKITGTGFAASETVTLQVKHTDGTVEGGEGHEP